jgi:hypothetical protein
VARRRPLPRCTVFAKILPAEYSFVRGALQRSCPPALGRREPPTLATDVVMNEDQDRTRLGNGPHNLAVFRHMALNALRRKIRGSLRGKFKRAGWTMPTQPASWLYSEVRLRRSSVNLIANIVAIRYHCGIAKNQRNGEGFTG